MEISKRHQWAQRFRKECEAKGFDWIEGSWDRKSGMTRGVLIGPPNAQQSQVIPMLHGLGNDVLYPMLGLMRHLLSLGWSVAACDIDGHGADTTSTLSGENITSCVDDFIDFITQHRPGRDRLHFIGYSFGATLLLEYANRNPERVHSLTMIGMPIQIPMQIPYFAEASSILLPSFRNSMKDYGRYDFIPAIGPIKRTVYPVRLQNGPTSEYIKQTRKIIASFDLANALQLITFPSIFISGTKDFIGPAQPIAGLNLPITRLQIYRVPNETHFTTLLSPLTWKRIEIFLRTVRS